MNISIYKSLLPIFSFLVVGLTCIVFYFFTLKKDNKINHFFSMLNKPFYGDKAEYLTKRNFLSVGIAMIGGSILVALITFGSKMSLSKNSS